MDNGNLATPPDNPNDPDEIGDSGLEIGNGWKKIDIASAAGVYTISENAINLTGKGKFASNEQTYALVYREITGDFTITVRLNSYASSGKNNNQARAGLLFTPDITTGIPYVINGEAGDGKYYVTKTGNNRTELTAPAAQGGTVYLKLARSGNTYSATYSLDGGATYGDTKTGTLDALPDKLYVGVAVNSGDNSTTGTATFSDVRVNGDSVPFTED